STWLGLGGSVEGGGSLAVFLVTHIAVKADRRLRSGVGAQPPSPMAPRTSHHEASPCSHQASAATRQSSGQRHTPSAIHSARVSGSGGAQPLFTSNHAWAARIASSAVIAISSLRA